MPVTSEIRSITPAMAQRLLNTQATNRSLNNNWVDQLVGIIQRGEWEMNGEAIIIDSAGCLIDGQHRLTAIVKSGITVKTLIVSGVSPDAIETIDRGTPRTLANVLEMRQEGYANALSAGLAYLNAWQTNGNFRLPGTTKMSVHQALALLEANPGLRASVRVGDVVARRAAIPAALAGVLHYVTAKIDLSDAEFFANQLREGAGMAADDPIFVLRERIALSRAVRANRLDTNEIAALYIKAWNAYRKGTKVRQLRWSPGGARPEDYPLPF